MKIAVVDPSGFTLPYDHRLCDALGAGGDDVRLYQRPPRDAEEERDGAYVRQTVFYRRSERIRVEGPSWVPYRVLKVAEHLLGFGTFCSQLTAWGPDVVHFQWLVLPWFDRIALGPLARRFPLVVTVHDTIPFYGSASSRIQTIGWIGSLSRFHRIIVHGRSSRQFLVQAGVDAARIAVIPHGIDLGPPRPASGERRTLLFFGNLKPYKGVDLLLRAYARLPEQLRRRAPLRIAGLPAMPTEWLRELCGWLGIAGTVEWDLRHVPEGEIPALFREARAVVMPYRALGTSGVAALAMGMGVPIVGSRVGVLPELIEDGKQGLLVAPDDEEALASALAALVGEPGLLARLEEGMLALREDLPTWLKVAGLTRRAYADAGAAFPLFSRDDGAPHPGLR